MSAIRDAEVKAASQNNSIISPLVGGQQSTPLEPQQSAPQADLSMFGMAAPEAMSQIEPRVQEFSKQLYESPYYKGLTGQADTAQKQLFKMDQAMEAAQQGVTPFPTPQWYVPNPADRVAAVAGQGTQVADITSGLHEQVGSTEEAYGAAIQGLMQKFLDFYKIQEDKRREEEERRRQEEQDRIAQERWKAEMDLAERKFADSQSALSGATDSDLAILESILGSNQNTLISGVANASQQTPQPTASGVYRVRDKATGQTGTLPSNEYNSSQYDYIGMK